MLALTSTGSASATPRIIREIRLASTEIVASADRPACRCSGWPRWKVAQARVEGAGLALPMDEAVAGRASAAWICIDRLTGSPWRAPDPPILRLKQEKCNET